MNQQVETSPQNLREKLGALVSSLESESRDRVGKRLPIERRWLEDLKQYHGQYDDETAKKLDENETSKLFINQTQPKTDAMAAKLQDLLFPTDDKNWGIKPTPVPDLIRTASRATMAAIDLRKKAEEARKAQQAQNEQVDQAKLQEAEELEEQALVADDAAKERQIIIDEAKRRSDLMSETMDDQLKHCRYPAQMRDVIDDASKLGSGICKGPVTGQRVRQGWKKGLERGANGGEVVTYNLALSEGNQPAYVRVDPWGFFPDMDARTVEECEGFFERHLKNKQQLRKLAKLPGFDLDAIRRLIQAGPRESAPSYLADLRNIGAADEVISKDLYHVWEYTGPITGEDMLLLAEAKGDDEIAAELSDIDPLEEVQAIIWFCDGEVLKFGIYPMDSGEPIYSIFSLVKAEASVLGGYGVPAIVREPQAAYNAGWRAMMDNGGLASGPQLVVATQYIEPEDGDYTIRPRKVWKAKTGLPKDARAFDAFDIPVRQAEMERIIALSKQVIDEVSSMPQITQGEPGNGVAQTVGGAVLIMNSNNVVFRRIVKNFDDDITVPNVRRLYDWNMQHGQDEKIKGDYEVDARGSSVLLVRELQAQNLFLIALHLGAHPVYGSMLKNRNVLKLLFQAHMIPADEVLLSEDDIAGTVDAATMQAQAQQQIAEVEKQKLELEREKFENQRAVEQTRAQSALLVESMRQETAMMKLAGQMNMNLDTLDARLEEVRINRQNAIDKLDTEERKLAAELIATEQYGPTGGGVV